MKIKQSKGLRDSFMPILSNHDTDTQVSDNHETIRTNADERWTKDDLASILSRSHRKNDIPKVTKPTRPKVEILRANSPTLRRLTAVRHKLEKHLALLLNTSRQSTHTTREKSSTSSKHDAQPKPNLRIPSSSSSSSRKQNKSQTNSTVGPLDKITYEKTLTHNGNVKKKCSLEIWLPKAGSDDDDNNDVSGDNGDEHSDYMKKTSPRSSPNHNSNEKKHQSPPLVPIRSRRESAVRITTITTTIAAHSARKPIDETSPKKPDPILIPRVYHYGDYLVEQPEERPHSGKSGNTNKSDGNGSNRGAKRHHQHSHPRRLSPSTNRSEDSTYSGPTKVPMSSKNLFTNIKQSSSGDETKRTVGPGNTLMINELMRKYSTIKKSHQELTRVKLQLEQPRHEIKHGEHTIKDSSPPSPPASDTTSNSSADHPTVSVKKLLVDSSPPRSAVTVSNTTGNTKLLDRRGSHRQPCHFERLPQARLLSIVNHLQHRQTSAATSFTHLPAVIGKKTDDSSHSFQRSKTMNINFDVSIDKSNRISSRLPVRAESPENVPSISNSIQYTSNRFEQTCPRTPKRSLPPPPYTLRLEQEQPQQRQVVPPLVQLVQYQNVQNSAQRYHHSAHTSTTDVSTNTVLVHLKYSNSGSVDRNCLVPK